MRKTMLFSLALICTTIAFASDTVQIPIPALAKPTQIAIDKSQIYIADGAEVCIFSLNDFKLKKKFGRRGEGPQEFKFRLDIDVNVQTGSIIVESDGKLSYFTKTGAFIKEDRLPPNRRKFRPLTRGVIGAGSAPVEEGYITISLYLFNSKYEMQKEIYRVRLGKRDKKRLFLQTPWDYHTYNDKIFLAAESDFKINVFDSSGKELYMIVHDYERLKATDELIGRFMNWIKKHRPPQFYENFKRLIQFPEYFPAVLQMRVSDDKLYVLTYKEKEGKSEFVVFDTWGKFIKQVWLPFAKGDPVHANPFVVSGGKVYQLVENEETEGWDIRIMPI